MEVAQGLRSRSRLRSHGDGEALGGGRKTRGVGVLETPRREVSGRRELSVDRLGKMPPLGLEA